MKKIIVTAGIIGMAAASISAYAVTGDGLARQAKISMQQARAIALKAFPGQITDAELEKEKGGSGLRYSFDIRNGHIEQEVGVDAMNGNLLENSREQENPD